jgi:CRP-like cAMP-binding protein
MTTGLVNFVGMRSLPTLWRRTGLSVFEGIELFDGFDGRALASLARHTDQLVLTPGVTVARQGCRSHEVVVVLSGEVEVSRDGTTLGTLGSGAVIGACEELSGQAHDVTLVAGAGVTALVIAGPAFRWAARAIDGFTDRFLAAETARIGAGLTPAPGWPCAQTAA